MDEQGKNHDDEQIVKDANSSYDDVDDLEWKVSKGGNKQRLDIIFRQRRRYIAPYIAGRRVLHRCWDQVISVICLNNWVYM